MVTGGYDSEFNQVNIFLNYLLKIYAAKCFVNKVSHISVNLSKK